MRDKLSHFLKLLEVYKYIAWYRQNLPFAETCDLYLLIRARARNYGTSYKTVTKVHITGSSLERFEVSSTKSIQAADVFSICWSRL